MTIGWPGDATVNAISVLTLALLALALALQPWSVLASVLLVSSRRGTPKALAFVVGWAGVLAAVGYIGVLVFNNQAARQPTSSTALAWLDLVAGLLIGVLLLTRWRRGPSGEPPKDPAWLRRIDGMSLPWALALGTFLPNYVFVVAAVNQLLQTDLSTTGLIIAVTAFVVVATLGVAAPLLLMAVRPGRAAEIHQRWRQWLVAHTRPMMYSLGGLVAVVLVLKGAVGLLT